MWCWESYRRFSIHSACKVVLLPTWIRIDQHQLAHLNAVTVSDVCPTDVIAVHGRGGLWGSLKHDADALASQGEMEALHSHPILDDELIV